MTRVVLAAPVDSPNLGHEIELWGHVLLGCISSREELNSVLDGVAAIEPSEVELLVVDAIADLIDQDSIAACVRWGISVVVIAHSPEDHARAAALGLAVIGAHQVSDRLPELLLGTLLREAIPAPADGTRGIVVAVWGAAGSPGASTIAVNLAAELALVESRKRRSARHEPAVQVCLVDADCWAPSVAPMWGLRTEAPGIAAAARCAEHDAWTKQEYLRLAVRGPAGVQVLSGLAALDRWPELSAGRITAVLDGLRDWCDVIVVDLGSHLEGAVDSLSDPLLPKRSAAARSIVSQADLVFGVGAADPISLARCVRAWPEWAGASRVSPELIVNRLRARVLGLAPEQQVRDVCEQFLGLSPIAVLPDDANVTDQALLRAQPLAEIAANSALRRQIRQLAGRIRERLDDRVTEAVEMLAPVP